MSTPFLTRFARAVVSRLVDQGRLELVDASPEPTVAHLAAQLGQARNRSLISTITNALVMSPHVEELYADDVEVKAIVDELERTVIRH